MALPSLTECHGNIITCRFDFHPNYEAMTTFIIFSVSVFFLLPCFFWTINVIFFEKVFFGNTMAQVVSFFWGKLSFTTHRQDSTEQENNLKLDLKSLKSVYQEPPQKVVDSEQATLYRFADNIEEAEVLNSSGSSDSDREHLKFFQSSGNLFLNEKSTSFKMKSSGLLQTEKINNT